MSDYNLRRGGRLGFDSGGNGLETVEMASSNEISELPAVIDGLEVRVDPYLQSWMMEVRPLPHWKAAWWPALCRLAAMAYHDGVNYCSAKSLKDAVVAATKSTDTTQVLLSKICMLTPQGYADAFADPPAQSLVSFNLTRSYLAKRGIAVVDVPLEEQRDAGVGYVMRVMRYRFLPHDPWYSVYLKDAPLPATSEAKPAGKGNVLGPRNYALPDWKRTAPPHRAITHAIRYLILEGVALSPNPKIPGLLAKNALNAVKKVEDPNVKEHPCGAQSCGNTPEQFTQIIRPWITPFVLTIFALDPDGLAYAVAGKDDNAGRCRDAE